MAFSKGKRIEDETSTRIVELAVNIGCKEGPDALTVTRLCKELNCDRRVIYNRFRDLDEINLLVSNRCNEELIAKAEEKLNEGASYFENFKTLMKAMLTYIYEKNAYFQYYSSLYKVTEDGLNNAVFQKLIMLIENGKQAGEVKAETNSREVAESIWLLIVGISGMLVSNVNYKYQDGLTTLMYSVEALVAYMQS